jgi:molecular chaperone DnaK (HSP70)
LNNALVCTKAEAKKKQKKKRYEQRKRSLLIHINLSRTYVTFDQSKRSVGQAAKAMEVTHAKNTISNFKRLLGRRYQDTVVQQEAELNAYAIVEGTGGSVNIEVNMN